jgi:hypothetical protein
MADRPAAPAEPETPTASRRFGGKKSKGQSGS